MQYFLPCRAQLTKLTLLNELLLYEWRIEIPSALCQDAVDWLHEQHQGIVKCRRRAIQSEWWPAISKNIKELIDNCRI